MISMVIRWNVGFLGEWRGNWWIRPDPCAIRDFPWITIVKMMLKNTTIILSLFFIIFWIIYVSISRRVIRKSNLDRKKRNLTVIVIFACVIFVLQSLFIVKSWVHLIALIPALALMSVLDICTTKFCSSCGTIIYKYRDLLIKRECPKCRKIL